jgi:hypothetical protein
MARPRALARGRDWHLRLADLMESWAVRVLKAAHGRWKSHTAKSQYDIEHRRNTSRRWRYVLGGSGASTPSRFEQEGRASSGPARHPGGTSPGKEGHTLSTPVHSNSARVRARYAAYRQAERARERAREGGDTNAAPPCVVAQGSIRYTMRALAIAQLRVAWRRVVRACDAVRAREVT